MTTLCMDELARKLKRRLGWPDELTHLVPPPPAVQDASCPGSPQDEAAPSVIRSATGSAARTGQEQAPASLPQWWDNAAFK